MKRLKSVVGAVFILLVFASIAWASGGEEGGHGQDWLNFLFRIINLVIFVGIIWWAAGKKIVGFFKGHRYNIESELKDLEARKAEAQKKLAEVEKGIANMAQEREEILADYKAQGERLKASIIEKAKEQAVQITEQAESAASMEVQYAVESIRAELADLVVESTQKILEEKLTKEEHEKLIDKYLTKVVFN